MIHSWSTDTQNSSIYLCFQVAVVEVELKLYAKYKGQIFLLTNKLFSFAFEKTFRHRN